MAVRIDIDATTLTVTTAGVDTALTLRRSIQIPLDAITAARVVTVSEAKGELGWRVAGSYLPGVFAAGWFTVPGKKGKRQWWAVYRDPEVLVIDTTLDQPARLVLQTAERHDLAQRLQLSARTS